MLKTYIWVALFCLFADKGNGIFRNLGIYMLALIVTKLTTDKKFTAFNDKQ